MTLQLLSVVVLKVAAANIQLLVTKKHSIFIRILIRHFVLLHRFLKTKPLWRIIPHKHLKRNNLFFETFSSQYFLEKNEKKYKHPP